MLKSLHIQGTLAAVALLLMLPGCDGGAAPAARSPAGANPAGEPPAAQSAPADSSEAPTTYYSEAQRRRWESGSASGDASATTWSDAPAPDASGPAETARRAAAGDD